MILKDVIIKFNKSTIKAGDGNQEGKYPLYTCSTIINKYLDNYLFNDEAIILGTGGNPVINYCNGKFSVSTDCLTIKANAQFLTKYLYYYLIGNINKIETMFRGAGLKHLNKNELLEMKIDNIDKEKQIKIVNQLDIIKDIMDRKEQQLIGLDEFIKSQFVEMFGDINTNEMNWNSEVLKKHLKVVGGYAFKSKEFKDNGIPILRIGNINAGYFKPKDLMFWQEDEKLSNYVIYPNDLVMSLTGTVGKEDYGNVCIMGNDFGKYYLNQRNAKLILSETINKFYITYALRVKEIKKRLTGISRGVRQANIANKDIENLNIPIPPIELQNQFAEIVKQIDKQKFKIEKSLKEMKKLNESLMNKYFGE